jgi:hypothetical protein
MYYKTNAFLALINMYVAYVTLQCGRKLLSLSKGYLEANGF